MDYVIRELSKEEYPLLADFLYEAIFIPEGTLPPPKTIINAPKLQIYICNFGKQEGDFSLCAETEGKIIGAVWVRIINDYGHLDDDTPSLAISLYKEWRNHGVGSALLRAMLRFLKKRGYKQVSLSVQKANYAVKMYRKEGFKVVTENDEDYVMLCKL